MTEKKFIPKQTFIPSSFEIKWQEVWEKKGVYQPDLNNTKRRFDKTKRKPFYNLMMFPYPSAEGLHVGNVYAFTGADIYGRYQRMKGNDVFEPIGLDGFGIHSENYAIKIGKHPSGQAKISEQNFYRQLHSIGNGYDWKNKLETYDPDYYRWTQWIFVQMFKHGLAYRKKSPVNFCPSCKTVLSDEQVIDGACERCKTPVELKYLEQWFFKITDFAERLLQNLSKIDWVKKVKIAQHNWIGKSEGAMLRFKVKDMDIHFEVFDSVPQTFMAQTFTVIAPEHPQLYELVKGTKYEKPVMDFVEKIKKKKAAKKFDIEKETEGIFTGRYVEYPPADRFLPIWAASFVVADYGTGVVNSSAHDERDFIFAQKYGIPLHPVMFPSDPKEAEKVKKLEYCYHHEPEGILTEPAVFKGRKWGEVRGDILDYIQKNGWGKKSSQYHLRDWLISRQRYWGPPIPMIYCSKCAAGGKSWFSSDEARSMVPLSHGSIVNNQNHETMKQSNHEMSGWYPVPEKDLPVKLPYIENYKPTGTGTSPLAQDKLFAEVQCPNCGGEARRETDVSDTFLDSSWYFLRYPSVGSQHSEFRIQKEDPTTYNQQPTTVNIPWDPEIIKKWLPVNIYIGGAEHSVLHLLYSRFVTMAFHDWGLLDFEEPFTRFYAHGLIIAEGAKMSKSKGNVIVPDQYISKYGADTLRTYLMFLGPFDMGGDFRDTGIAGMHKFLGRVWRLVMSCKLSVMSENRKNPQPATHNPQLLRVMHHAIKEVTEDMENLRYNTAIAHIMEYVNELTNHKNDPGSFLRELDPGSLNMKLIETLLLLLAPFAPHMTEELFQKIKNQKSPPKADQPLAEKIKNETNNQQPTTYNSIHLHPWPSYDPKYLIEDEVTIVVQVNGKTRGTIRIQNSESGVQNKVENEARKSERINKYLEGKSVIKVIFVAGRLINFVVK